MATLRFGIVGLGYIGKYHALGATEAPGTALVAGFDPDPEKRAAFQLLYPDPYSRSSLISARVLQSALHALTDKMIHDTFCLLPVRPWS